MEYRNFDMRISPTAPGHFHVAVTSSPHGTCSGSFQLPPGLVDFQMERGEDRIRRDLSPQRETASPAVVLSPQHAGVLLFQAVFNDRVGDLFKKCHEPGLGLRIRLTLPGSKNDANAASLHGLPWELMYYEQHLGVTPAYSIVRQLDGELPVPQSLTPISSPFKLRILLVGVNPNDTHPLDLEQEKRMLSQLAENSILEVEPLEEISRQAFHNKLEEGFHVVHFMGHGDWVDGRPVLFFLNEHGDCEEVTGRELAEEIRGLTSAQRPRLFVLNACHGGVTALGTEGLTGVAAELVLAGVPAVAAMLREIGDEAAVCFSNNFYRCLAQGLKPDEAMAKSRLALKREPQFFIDWATPCLFSNLESPPFPIKENKKVGRTLKIAGVLFLLLLTFGLVSIFQSNGDTRLVVDVLGESLDGTWDFSGFAGQLSQAQGFDVVEKNPDFRVRVYPGKSWLTALVSQERSGRSVEVALGVPAQGKSMLGDQLATRVLEILEMPEESWASQPQITAQALAANNRALDLLNDGELAGAERAFEECLKRNPDYAAAHANLAVVLMDQGRYLEALEHVSTAIDLAPRQGLFHYHHGCILVELSREEEAERAFNRALDLNPQSAFALAELAKIRMNKEDWEGARRLLEKALRVDPLLVPALKNLGRCYLENGFPEEGLVWLENAESAASNDQSLQISEILVLKARAWLELGQIEKARAAVLAYTALPGSQFLPWGERVAALAADLNMEAAPQKVGASSWPLLPTSAPLAVFTWVSGLFTITPGQGPSWNARFRTLLRPGVKISAEPGAEARLICAKGGVLELEGPGEWMVEDLPCQAGDSTRLFETLLALNTRQSSSQGALVKSISRPGVKEDFFIMAPLGLTDSSTPDLVWTAVPKARAYTIVLDDSLELTLDLSELRTEHLKLGHSSLNLLRLAWPDDPLWFGADMAVEISPLFDDARPMDLARGRIRFLNEKAAESMQSLMQTVDGLPFSPVDLLTAKAEIYVSNEMWSRAAASRLEQIALQGQSSHKLALAQIWIASDLDHAAALLFESMLQEPQDMEIRAFIEEGLGRLAVRSALYNDGLTHLGRARALYKASHRADRVLLMDRVMAETSALFQEKKLAEKEPVK